MITNTRTCRASGVARGFCLAVLAAASAVTGHLPGVAVGAAQANTIAPATAPSHADRTRFIIGLRKPAKFQVFTLTNPNRVIVEMDTEDFLLPRLPTDGPVGVVKTFSGGKAGNGKSRVIVSVTEPVVVDTSKIVPATTDDSHHLILDFLKVKARVAGREAFERKYSKPVGLLGANNGETLGSKIASSIGQALSGLLSQPPLPRPAQSPEELAERSYRPVIVIDPGHGGHDPGARKNGVVEKNVVLAFAKVLRDQLKATGRYKVLMTRDTDTFVSLDGRRAFAERKGAELFIAVHADYARSSARGATVYSLRQKVANRLRRKASGASAAKLTGASFRPTTRQDKSAVKTILGDLYDREIKRTRLRTDVVSRSLVKFMGTATNMRPNPHKEAAFRVLKTAQFPSVLVELAYVTNRRDARQLKSQSWRKKVSKSMVEAVDRYFSTQVARLPL